VAGETLVVLGRQPLVAEHQHVVGQEGALDLLQLLVRQLGRQVETGHLGADRRRQRLDRDGVIGRPRQRDDALDRIQDELLHPILLQWFDTFQHLVRGPRAPSGWPAVRG
jgi:hypothetical protein